MAAVDITKITILKELIIFYSKICRPELSVV